jgi:hypothetical protein
MGRLRILLLLAACIPAAGMQINVLDEAKFAGNPDALAAFKRAAFQWTSLLNDPIAVYIDAQMGAFSDPLIIGSASSVLLASEYHWVRGQMAADAGTNPNNAIVHSLPATAAQLPLDKPSNVTWSGDIAATKANFKALGYTGLDGLFGNRDATITFNSGFAFDYDNRNGVDAGKIDFETVATHEIGHALGFISAVDWVDAVAGQPGPFLIDVMPLDLFRFAAAVGSNPTASIDFASTPRYLGLGPAIFDDVDHEWQFSTGYYNGDGNQASHWKADEDTGVYIGMLDPTLSRGTVQSITAADIRALDLIGYDYQAVPEPSTVALLAGGLILLFVRKRRGTVPR